MPQYIACYRASFDAATDTDAAMIAENIRQNAEKDLDTEEEDEVIQTQLTELRSKLSPHELIISLIQSRNGLVSTRVKECWDVAESIHQTIHALKRMLTPEEASVSYDHSSFMRVAQSILDGGNPQ